MQIATDHGFDGWLINVENTVCPGQSVDVLVHFVKSLTARMRAATAGGAPCFTAGGAADQAAAAAAPEDEEQEEMSPPSTPAGEGGEGGGIGVVGSAARAAHGSTVLWYDSVTVDGELDWQDRLNGKNRVFFDACDGIFSNYCWKADYPSACALEASARRCVLRVARRSLRVVRALLCRSPTAFPPFAPGGGVPACVEVCKKPQMESIDVQISFSRGVS